MIRIQELLNRKRQDVASQKKANPDVEIPSDQRVIRWERNEFRLIAELKRASLSAGTIRQNLQLTTLAHSYEQAGASALSVLTEEHYFHGSLQDLREIRSEVSLPILQKDFILDRYQIAQAKNAGASFVLIIVRFLSTSEISDLVKYAEDLGLNAILEITSQNDLEKLVTSPSPRYIGVNSRDLDTLEVDTTKFESLRPFLPDAFLIAESGIRDIETLTKVISAGYHGALIGEHFLRCEDPAAELAKFVGAALVARNSSDVNEVRPFAVGESPLQVLQSRTKVKICGITSEHDAFLAIHGGANALGFIFAESPRQILPDTLASFRNRIPKSILCVGVFRGQTVGEINETVQRFNLDVAQVYDDVQPSAPIWKANVIRSIDDFTAQNGKHPVLWDLKADEPHLSFLWKEVGKHKIFALAGGLNPENVSRAVACCNPEWVDVARGVEREPGIKDETKIHAFLRQLQ